MSEKTKIPLGVRKILGQVARGLLTPVEAAGRLGAFLDKKAGTESMSLFRRGAKDRELRYGKGKKE
jgi:hypothetical protein